MRLRISDLEDAVWGFSRASTSSGVGAVASGCLAEPSSRAGEGERIHWGFALLSVDYHSHVKVSTVSMSRRRLHTNLAGTARAYLAAR